MRVPCIQNSYPKLISYQKYSGTPNSNKFQTQKQIPKNKSLVRAYATLACRPLAPFFACARTRARRLKTYVLDVDLPRVHARIRSSRPWPISRAWRTRVRERDTTRTPKEPAAAPAKLQPMPTHEAHPVFTCLVCGRVIETCLARLGSLTCLEHRTSGNVITPDTIIQPGRPAPSVQQP